MTTEQYVVRLRAADEKRLDLISFGTATPADADALAGRLAADGVQLISEPGKLDTPGGGYGFRFFDLDGRTVNWRRSTRTPGTRTSMTSPSQKSPTSGAPPAP